MLVDAEFLSDGAADIDMAAFLHIDADLLATEADGIETDIVDLVGSEAVFLEILDEARMRYLEGHAVGIHEFVGVFGEFTYPDVVGFAVLIVVGDVTCQEGVEHLDANLDGLLDLGRNLIGCLQKVFQTFPFILESLNAMGKILDLECLVVSFQLEISILERKPFTLDLRFSFSN